MYTQLARQLTTLFEHPGDPQLGQQLFGNCAQPLVTRGPVSINNGASAAPPRAGVINSIPNAGGLGGSQASSGGLSDYYNGFQQTWNQYSGDTWNPSFFAGDNYFYAGDNNYWGGDTFYGDNYLTTNQITSPQYFNQNILNNYNTTNIPGTSSGGPVGIGGGNVSNWYNNTFNDQSYNDFQTNLNVTSNAYNQTTNNFAGDSYFDNTNTNNLVTNNITNNGPTTNNGDVTNNSNTYLTENTYITNGPTFVTIRQFIEDAMRRNRSLLGGPPFQKLTGTATVEVPSAFTLGEDCGISIAGYQKKTVSIELDQKVSGDVIGG